MQISKIIISHLLVLTKSTSTPICSWFRAIQIGDGSYKKNTENTWYLIHLLRTVCLDVHCLHYLQYVQNFKFAYLPSYLTQLSFPQETLPRRRMSRPRRKIWNQGFRKRSFSAYHFQTTFRSGFVVP